MKSSLWKPATGVVVLTALVLGLVMLLAGCGPEEEVPAATPVSAAPPTDTPPPSPAPSEVEGETEEAVSPPAETSEVSAEEPPAAAPPPQVGSVIDKWALWINGTQLRGANIHQRHVYPELDGLEFMGPGPLGTPYTQEDFNRLAALGANYVNISHPGLFTEKPPYTLDQEAQDNLDNLLDMIAQADMFAVISFRTGPGRAEFSVCCLEEVGDWFDESYLNDSVWQDQATQDAWAEMWRYTAERYRGNPIVVGYDLMVEPNSNEVWLDLWDQEEFYANYGGTLYDWNQLYPRITAAIREVDSNTPILIGGMGYSAIAWLPYMQPTEDPRTVYAVHQYAPSQYTHQWRDSIEVAYPVAFDTDWDGVDDQFDRAWLDDLLSTIDDFATTFGAPVAVNEFGVIRWVPGGAAFMDDQMDLFEERGINHALWEWSSSWEPHAENDAFNFRHGPEPDHHTDMASSDLMDVIVRYWGRNTIRPSNAAEELAALIVETDEVVETPEQPEEVVPVLPGVIDDFEGGDFDDRWWSYTGEGTISFTCTPDQPGHASAHAMRLTFEVGADGYASCGVDVDPDQWEEAEGLSFLWRADQPGLMVIVVLDMEDPTQTNPEAEGITPFGAEL
jgi:hypothetical protein